MIHHRQSLVSFNKQCMEAMPEGFIVTGICPLDDGTYVGYVLRWASWPAGGLLKAVSPHVKTPRQAWKTALDLAEGAKDAFAGIRYEGWGDD